MRSSRSQSHDFSTGGISFVRSDSKSMSKLAETSTCQTPRDPVDRGASIDPSVAIEGSAVVYLARHLLGAP